MDDEVTLPRAMNSLDDRLNEMGGNTAAFHPDLRSFHGVSGRNSHIQVQIVCAEYDLSAIPGMDRYYSNDDSLAIIRAEGGEKRPNRFGPAWVDKGENESGEKVIDGFTQLYRSGDIEAIGSLSFEMEPGLVALASEWLEAEVGKEIRESSIIWCISHFLRAQDDLGADYPRLISISFAPAKKEKIGLYRRDRKVGNASPISETVTLPKIIINRSEDVEGMPRRVEEMVWNAFGLVSPNVTARARLRDSE